MLFSSSSIFAWILKIFPLKIKISSLFRILCYTFYEIIFIKLGDTPSCLYWRQRCTGAECLDHGSCTPTACGRTHGNKRWGDHLFPLMKSNHHRINTNATRIYHNFPLHKRYTMKVLMRCFQCVRCTPSERTWPTGFLSFLFDDSAEYIPSLLLFMGNFFSLIWQKRIYYIYETNLYILSLTHIHTHWKRSLVSQAPFSVSVVPFFSSFPGGLFPNTFAGNI